MIILTVHPVMQILALLTAVYVFWLGLKRFLAVHLNYKAVFRWKAHVISGSVALTALLTGSVAGVAAVYVSWNVVMFLGTHVLVAYFIIPMLLAGLLTGIVMNREKKKRLFLPLAHGINNAVLIILVLWQAETGWRLYAAYVLGL